MANGMRTGVLCFLELSKAVILGYKYESFQRLIQLALSYFTVYLLVISCYI